MKPPAESPPRPLHGAQLWPLSVAAYRSLGEAGLIPRNTELLYGFVYTKMSKSPYHSFLVGRLIRLLESVLPPGHLLRSEQPLTCLDSEPEPDIALVRGAEEDFRDQHPARAEIVIEVCVTSHEYDRSKLKAYAVAGVKECWFVLCPEKQIEVYRLPKDGQFAERALHGLGGTLASSSVPGLVLSLQDLFAR